MINILNRFDLNSKIQKIYYKACRFLIKKFNTRLNFRGIKRVMKFGIVFFRKSAKLINKLFINFIKNQEKEVDIYENIHKIW